MQDYHIIKDRIDTLIKLLQNDNLYSYDPYDGLSSPISSILTLKNNFLLRVFQQIVFRAPINLRPFLGIKKMLHTKAVSDFVSGFAILYDKTNDEIYKKNCLDYLEKLNNISVSDENGKAWGLRFPFATRFVQANASAPNIFQTINAINAYLDVYELVDKSNNLLLNIVSDSLRYIKTVFGFIENDDYIFWKYWKGVDAEIFNVNGLMLGILSRLYTITKKEEYRHLAIKTYKYLQINQNIDGSWYYAKGTKAMFIDGFHTGYILEGISRSILSGCNDIDDTFKTAVDFYLKNLFNTEGIPKYYHNKLKPFDAQNGAQAIQTLVFLNKVNFASLNYVLDVFTHVDKIFWNEKGYYDFRKKTGIIYTTPMHRWATGPLFLALSYLFNEIELK